MNYPIEMNEYDIIKVYQEIEMELKHSYIPNIQDRCQNLIKSYLNNETEFNFYRFCLSYSMYAIKSYGQERRFFNPPPQLQMAKRTTLKIIDTTTVSEQKPTLYDYFLTIKINGYDENVSIPFSNENMDFSLKKKKTKKRRDQNFDIGCEMTYEFDKYGVASAINTHINEFDFDRFITLKTKILINGHNNILGCFESNPIKVISKPAKKKLKSLKLNNCNIISGSLVALSNRFRSQSLSTKYIYIDENCINCHQSKYSGVYIYKIKQVGDEYITEEGPITYGSLVRLVSYEGNLHLPLMYVRKITKNSVEIDCSDACLSMNRVAFECVDKPNNFLSLSTNTIRFYDHNDSNGVCDLKSLDLFKSLSVWLLINIERIVFNFIIPTTSLCNPNIIPLITNVTQFEIVGEKRGFEVIGRDLSPSLQIFIGSYPIKTIYRCSNLIIGSIININDMDNEMINIYTIDKIKNGIMMPILLVCSIQNIIFDTEHCAFYGFDMLSNNLFLKITRNTELSKNSPQNVIL